MQISKQNLALKAKDVVLGEAKNIAYEAVLEVARSEQVGDYLGLYQLQDKLVVHCFECLSAGYPGWIWTVIVTRVPRCKQVTVCEVSMQPSDEALLAPRWVPWVERLQGTDLRPGDVIPKIDDDPRLELVSELTDAQAYDEEIVLGISRKRVLSAQGRKQAFNRWYNGEHGPFSDLAKAAKADCSSCGFFMYITGTGRALFGVCANEWSPNDGRVVSVDHGCGAHSETEDKSIQKRWVEPKMVLDDKDIDTINLG